MKIARTQFEGKEFRGIKDYDSYLNFKFGKYMELPPKELRKVHPMSRLKLDVYEGKYVK